MTEYLTIFFTGFVSVFALGFQSRNVNHGHYAWAAGTSFFIGVSNAFLWKFILSPNAGFTGALVYGAAGALAISASMYIHERYISGPYARANEIQQSIRRYKFGTDM